MQMHLEQHEQKQRDLMREAEQHRLHMQMRSQNAKVNPVLKKLGQMLIEAGERLQEDEYKQVHPAR